MIHSPGSHLAGTWAIPEEAALDVFLPYILLREKPALRPVFAHLVQYFAQHVATAAMDRWDNAKGIHVSGPIDDAGVPRSSFHDGHAQPLIPVSSTPRHMFYGRRAGTIDQLIAAEGLQYVPPPPPLLAPTSPAPPILTQTVAAPPLLAPKSPAPNLPCPSPTRAPSAKPVTEGARSNEQAVRAESPFGKP